MDVPPELVSAARDGDREALEDLISRSYRAAYTLALRLMGNPEDAAEATQEAYIRIVRGLRRLDEDAAFRTWMFKIVSNVCMTEMRKRRRRDIPTELEALEESASAMNGGSDAEELATSRLFRQEIERLITELPEVYRSVVVLRDVYGLSGEETADAMGISPGAVKVRLHRARRKLRDALVERFPDWGTGSGRKESA